MGATVSCQFWRESYPTPPTAHPRRAPAPVTHPEPEWLVLCSGPPPCPGPPVARHAFRGLVSGGWSTHDVIHVGKASEGSVSGFPTSSPHQHHYWGRKWVSLHRRMPVADRSGCLTPPPANKPTPRAVRPVCRSCQYLVPSTLEGRVVLRHLQPPPWLPACFGRRCTVSCPRPPCQSRISPKSTGHPLRKKRTRIHGLAAWSSTTPRRRR